MSSNGPLLHGLFLSLVRRPCDRIAFLIPLWHTSKDPYHETPGYCKEPLGLITNGAAVVRIVSAA